MVQNFAYSSGHLEESITVVLYSSIFIGAKSPLLSSAISRSFVIFRSSSVLHREFSILLRILIWLQANSSQRHSFAVTRITCWELSCELATDAEKVYTFPPQIRRYGPRHDSTDITESPHIGRNQPTTLQQKHHLKNTQQTPASVLSDGMGGVTWYQA